ncbi:unnamed protein product [Lampetra planeri]
MPRWMNRAGRGALCGVVTATTSSTVPTSPEVAAPRGCASAALDENASRGMPQARLSGREPHHHHHGVTQRASSERGQSRAPQGRETAAASCSWWRGHSPPPPRVPSGSAAARASSAPVSSSPQHHVTGSLHRREGRLCND